MPARTHNSNTEITMPAQQTFLDRQTGDRRVQVVKTYDRQYAREAFNSMNETAKTYLWRVLAIAENYETSDLPAMTNQDRDDILLEELLSAGREDWQSFSYFVVIETMKGESATTFVSGDWPSAEAFANSYLSPLGP
jgi:hypothetical protein